MTTLYSETITPWFAPLTFFLPMFYKYGIIIDKLADGKIFLSFGYGFSGPSKSNNFISHTTLLANIDPSTVVTGDASWQDNLYNFGGWGVRYGCGGTWAYNATLAGPYCEFVETREGGGSERTRYRIVTKNPELIARWLRGEITE